VSDIKVFQAARTAEQIGDERAKQIIKELNKRQEIAEEMRAPYDLVWDDLDDYVMPRRGVYDIGTRKGKDKGEKLGALIFDGTGGAALTDLADGLQGQTASPLITWVQPRWRAPLAKRDRVALQWMDDIHEGMMYEMKVSNFYEQLNEGYNDAVTYGPATMRQPVWDEVNQKLVYMSHNPREIFYFTNSSGQINVWHRKYPITGQQIMDDFPNAKFTAIFKKKLEDKPRKEYICIHAVFQRTERDVTKLNGINKPWASIYFLPKENVLLSEGGFDRKPLDTWRYRVNTNEVYPRSPAIDEIFDIMMTNEMAMSMFKSAQLAVMPSFVATEGLKGRIKLKPHGITWKQFPGDTLEAIRYPTQFAIGIEQINKLRSELRDRLKANTFSLLASLDKVFSATQTIEMAGEKAAILAPMCTRNQAECLVPQLNGTFAVLARNGRLPPPPSSLEQYMNSPVDWEFLGPVAVTARRYLQLQSIDTALPKINSMIDNQTFPEMRHILDPIELGIYILESSGVPQKIVRDRKDIMARIAAEAKQKQQQFALGAAQSAAESYNKTTGAPAKGSPAEGAMVKK
jgi:hypothetical protein